ncbi:MAG: hypothetical protein K9M45_00255 [Kiritimatiellales bacterium]|nr:hypothetical protein [Kiritimatiellales bacterium]
MKKTVVLGLLTICIAGCAGWPQSKIKLADADVVIAMQNSRFKRGVVEKLTQRLEAVNLSYRVVQLKELRSVSVENHKAVVVINKIWAWHLNDTTSEFLLKTPPEAREKVILISTVGRETWEPDVPGVQAITSASKKSNQDKVVSFAWKNIGRLCEGSRL